MCVCVYIRRGAPSACEGGNSGAVASARETAAAPVSYYKCIYTNMSAALVSFRVTLFSLARVCICRFLQGITPNCGAKIAKFQT